MSNRWMTLCIVLAALVLLAVVTARASSPAQEPNVPDVALGAEFTYQGQLKLDDQPVDNTCDFQFSLYDDEQGSTQVGATQAITGVQVAGGLFTVQLDFGTDAFQGDVRWLGIEVQCQGDAEYADLGTQALTATPYALYALAAPWDGITDMPAGFADGVDDVGAGGDGDITAVYAGYGLDGGGETGDVTLDVLTDTIQSRVSESCLAGSSIRLIHADGTVECEEDDTGQGGGGDGDITAVLPGDGLTGGALSGTATLTVAFSGSGVATTVARSDHDHDERYYTESELNTSGGGGTVHWDNLLSVPPDLTDGDDDTTYTAGIGLALAGTQFSITPTYSLPQACSGGQIAEWDGAAWVCADDDDSTDFWSLSGNAGIDPASHFLGTSDEVSLTLAVNGTPALRLEPTEGTSNLIGGYGGNHAVSGTVGAVIGGGGYVSGVNAVSGDYATVGGGLGNTAGGAGAFVGGGGFDGTTYDGNEALGDVSTIGGGLGNLITSTAPYATIGGGRYNTAGGERATVGGGWGNTASGNRTTVGGGVANTVSGNRATIGGGQSNAASGEDATVGGGWDNTASGSQATIGGGEYNAASGWDATIGGGYNNAASGESATVGGGFDNTAALTRTTIAGGGKNYAGDPYATVGGGLGNTAGGAGAFVGGGGFDGTTYDGNEALGDVSTIGGGLGNLITSTAPYATIGGGWYNTASGHYATIGGGYNNAASGEDATVGGGQYNTASGWRATIGGGGENAASKLDATIGGGGHNIAGGERATIGGGSSNAASGWSATIGGGEFNTASGYDATVGGGRYNTASGDYATISGGQNNTASANCSVVAGGCTLSALGAHSFAAGYRAQALHAGTFVWADASETDFVSQRENQFRVQAGGGARFDVNDGAWIEIYAQDERLINTSSGAYLSASGVWNEPSDRNLKAGFAPVDTAQVLAGVVELPISTWSYRVDEPTVRHIGPVAQDFYAAFGLGQDERHIASLDASGVALAAIQALATENATLRAENAVQQEQIDSLESRLSALESGNSGTSSLQIDLLPGAGLLLAGGLGLWLVRYKGGGR